MLLSLLIIPTEWIVGTLYLKWSQSTIYNLLEGDKWSNFCVCTTFLLLILHHELRERMEPICHTLFKSWLSYTSGHLLVKSSFMALLFPDRTTPWLITIIFPIQSCAWTTFCFLHLSFIHTSWLWMQIYIVAALTLTQMKNAHPFSSPPSFLNLYFSFLVHLQF